jgi:hypothetical protein
MLQEELVESGHASQLPAPTPTREIVVPDAPPVRLQRLDIARHVAVTPQGKRYVVATFDDRHLKRGFVTAIYPQQNGYLTLVRLLVREFHNEDIEQAVQQHIKSIEAIQKGQLSQLVKSR